jgi:hypothetical protein
MLAGIGAFLIVVGFILGVICGVLLSLPRVIKDENGQVRQGKLASITILCVVSVVMIFIGQGLFFDFRFDPLKY